MRGLAALTDLSLSHNALASAAFVPQLPSLTQLGLSHNQLSALPADLDGLTRLHSLGVAHNQLTALPDALFQARCTPLLPA